MRAGAKFKCMLLGVALGIPSWATAQLVTATLTALDTRVMVGMPFKVDLSVRHPEGTVVIFPDSAADFLPYEVHQSQPKPTQTHDGISVDGEFYDLYTWEIDSVQHITFPVKYLDAQGDTQVVYSNRVEVLFQPVIAEYSDSLKIQLFDNLAPIEEPFDWLGFLIIGAAVLLLVSLIIGLAWKPASRALRRWQVRRDWERFRTKYESVLPLLPRQDEYTTELLRAWKDYLDRKGYLELHARTTAELEKALATLPVLTPADVETLLDFSHARDMVLYAGLQMDETRLREFHALIGSIMQKEYQRRKEAAEAL